MKNQYVGDIGDYTKLAILRNLENAGFSVGINWYLTQDDIDIKDGRHIKYLDLPCDTPDTALYDELREIVKVKQTRTVEAISDSGLLKNAVYYNEPLDLSGPGNRRQIREIWRKHAMLALRLQKVIFLDPDNGFETDSTNPYSSNGTKYVTYDEAADYYNTGASVIVYSHKDRSPEEKYIERLRRIMNYISINEENVFCVKAHRYSVRDYLFLTHPEHHEQIKQAIDEMIDNGWRKYLSYRILAPRNPTA